MRRVVVDCSALVAALFREAGADRLSAPGRELLISAASYSEVLSQACGRGAPLNETVSVLNRLSINVSPLGEAQVLEAARLRLATVHPPLPSETWFAISLAALSACPLLTADPALGKLRVGVTIECIR